MTTKLKAIADKQTKTQIIRSITEETGLTRKDVEAVLESLTSHAHRHLMARGSGEFTVPFLGVKLRRVERKARMGRNPATGEMIKIKAKKAIRATPLKVLKDLVA